MAPKGLMVKRKGKVLLVSVISLAVLLAVGWVAWHTRPLMARLKSASPGAVEELIQRFNSGRLSGEELPEFIAYALKVQGDTNWNHPSTAPWSISWGRFIETVHAAGALPAASWQTYAAQSVNFDLDVRGPVRRGDPVPVRLRMTTRLGPSSRFRIEYDEAFELGGKVKVPGEPGTRTLIITSSTYGNSYWWNVPVSAAARKQLGNGPEYARAYLNVRIFDPSSGAAGKLLAQRRIELFESYSQWPTNQAAKQMTYGEPERQVLEKRLSIKGIDRWRPGSNSMMLEFGRVSVSQPIACEIWLREGDREWQIASHMQFHPGDADYGVECNALGITSDRVDVLIRPAYINEWDPYTVYPRDVSQYEVIFPNVPIYQGMRTRQLNPSPSTGRASG